MKSIRVRVAAILNEIKFYRGRGGAGPPGPPGSATALRKEVQISSYEDPLTLVLNPLLSV